MLLMGVNVCSDTNEKRKEKKYLKKIKPVDSFTTIEKDTIMLTVLRWYLFVFKDYL